MSEISVKCAQCKWGNTMGRKTIFQIALVHFGWEKWKQMQTHVWNLPHVRWGECFLVLGGLFVDDSFAGKCRACLRCGRTWLSKKLDLVAFYLMWENLKKFLFLLIIANFHFCNLVAYFDFRFCTESQIRKYLLFWVNKMRFTKSICSALSCKRPVSSLPVVLVTEYPKSFRQNKKKKWQGIWVITWIGFTCGFRKCIPQRPN